MENCVHQMYSSFGFLKKFGFVECKNLGKINRKSKNVPNHENSMENCAHQMYKYFGFVEKFDFVVSTKL